jgi:DNA-binding NarL/FixJ family response regulator
VSDRPIKLLLIDDDPIFRLGLATAIQSLSDFQVRSQADSIDNAIARLSEEMPDVIVLEPLVNDGWLFCQQKPQNAPDLPIFLLSATSDWERLMAARASGVQGYAPKGTAIDDLVEALRRIAAGGIYWQATAAISKDSVPVRKNQWLVRTYQSGLQQIEEELAKVEQQLENSQLSLLDWFFWSGRRRELLTSRWLVKRLLPVETIVISQQKNERSRLPQENQFAIASLPPAASLVKSTTPSILVWNDTLEKIQLGIENLTNIPLEIDILQSEKRRELFYLVLDRFQKLIEELRLLNVTREELPQKKTLVLQSLLESSLLELFSNYYTSIELNNEKIIDIFSQDSVSIQTEILAKVPMVDNLLGFFIFEDYIAIDNVLYRAESPEAMARAELLLQNLTVQIANSVMQILLNNFSEIEIIKQNFYGDRYFSSREMARFRNEISWRYQREKYIEEPKNIFESQYRLFVLNGSGIKTTSIYAPRQNELARLQGLPWFVTIAWELRDSLSPRLRSIVAFLGNGAVYLLTQVLGRAIGLVGRGIAQGIGNSLEDKRYGGRKSQVASRKSQVERRN